jgi:hypothetical protein
LYRVIEDRARPDGRWEAKGYIYGDRSRLESPGVWVSFVFYQHTGRPKFTPNAHSSTAFATKDLRGVFLLVMGVLALSTIVIGLSKSRYAMRTMSVGVSGGKEGMNVFAINGQRETSRHGIETDRQIYIQTKESSF